MFGNLLKHFGLRGTNVAHIFDVRARGKGGHKSFFCYEKASSALIHPHLNKNDDIPWRDSVVVDIKEGGEKGKFKYEKICETLKFMAEQYYSVCMCLCYLDGTPKLSSGLYFHFEKKTFYVSIDFPSKVRFSFHKIFLLSSPNLLQSPHPQNIAASLL